MTDLALPKTTQILKQGVAEEQHLGAQLYVCIEGRGEADLAMGEARPGEAMRSDHLLPWLSASKPTVAAAIMRLWEKGKLELDDTVARHIPEFAQGGKEAVTIRHILTHTAGMRNAERNRPARGWDRIIAHICATPLEPRWVPGQQAGYHHTSSWFILGEIVRRVAGQPVEHFVREQIFEPLGMRDCWLAITQDQYDDYGSQLAMLYRMWEKPVDVNPRLKTYRDWCDLCIPGGSGIGPARELARFYRMLLNGGELDGARILSRGTVASMTYRHRQGMYDRSHQRVLDWGLGLMLCSRQYGAPVPYGYGEHASPDAFGHGGRSSSIAFADPKHGLVVAWICNGQPGEDKHQVRNWKINTAIYEDLGLAE